jgi:hypothetical protein
LEGKDVVAFVRWSVDWDALDDMQAFASRYVRRRWPGELADRARVSACELLENAVRYATAGGTVDLSLLDHATGFEVRVANDAVPARQQILRKCIQDCAHDDATEQYRRSLRRLLTDTEGASNASLGLLRIRCEAAVELAVQVEGKRVTVVATGSRDSTVAAKREVAPTSMGSPLTRKLHGTIR